MGLRIDPPLALNIVSPDVRFAMVPINRRDARRMIDGLRSRRILDGQRGKRPSDLRAIEDALLRLSQLVQDFPAIREIDLNPVLALPDACVLADARIVVDR